MCRCLKTENKTKPRAKSKLNECFKTAEKKNLEWENFRGKL